MTRRTSLTYLGLDGGGRLRLQEVGQRTSLVLAWIVVVVIFSALLPGEYPTTQNFASIFGSQAFIAFLALGLIIVLRVGEFDLSVAATMTIGSDVLAALDTKYGFSPILAVLVTLLIGVSIGLANGIFVVKFGIDSFIATLGVATILQGAALWLTGQSTIVGVSEIFTSWIVVNRLGGISLEFYYALGLMLVLAYVFRYTVLGRRLLIVGKNKEVARLSGIDVSRIKIGAFVATGAISAGAGILLTGTSGSADPTSGLSFLLPVYAAAFLGSTTSSTGEFTPVATFVAIYFLVSGVQGLAIAGVPIFVQQFFYGSVLIVAVSASRVLSSGGIARLTASRASKRAVEAGSAPTGDEAS